MATEEHEEMPHTYGVSGVVETGDEQEVQMILGDREKIRHAGIIRAGVQTIKASASPELKKKFLELEAQGLPYSDIDRALGGQPKSKKTLLRPTNIDHFSVRRCDFKNPADADYILQHYADPDGHVRRIPIWFVTNDMAQAVPHGFRAFGGDGSVRASSFYDHGELCFRYLPQGKKGKDDWLVYQGTGDEDHDIEEVSELCGAKVQFGGLYRVQIVGLKTFGEVIVPTRSWNGLSDAVAVLKRVRSILGRFNNLVNGQHFLVLTKVPERVKAPDGTHKLQHIITIDADCDPMELARHAEHSVSRGMSSIAMFNGEREARRYREEHLSPTSPNAPTSHGIPSQEPQEAAQGDNAGTTEEPFGQEDPAIGQAMEWLHNMVKWLGVTWEAFCAYVVHDFPCSVDKMNIGQLRELSSEVKKQSAGDNKDAFSAYIGDIHRGVGDGGEFQEEEGLPFN